MDRKLCLVIIYGIIFFLGINMFTDNEPVKPEKADVVETQQDILDTVEVDSKPAVIYFYTPWCQSCRKFNPYWEKAVKLNEDRFRCIKINAEESKNIPLAREFNIRSVPTVYIYDKANGKRIQVRNLLNLSEELAKY